MSKLTPEQIMYVCDNYYVMPKIELANYLGVSVSYLHRFAIRNGLTANRPTLNEADIIYDYITNKKTIKELEIKYKISRPRIKELIISNKLLYRNQSEAAIKIPIDDTYFTQIDTEQKAYFLGYMYADGNVYKTRFKLELNKQDIDILYVFLQELKSTRKIYEYKNNRSVLISNKKMVDDLISLGCGPRKTYNLRFPSQTQVPDHLLSHFIRGYFDGDGSICIFPYKSAIWRFTIMAPYLFCTQLQSILQPYFSSLFSIVKDKRINSEVDMYTLFTSSSTGPTGTKNIHQIYDYLYKDATIFLGRKKEVFARLIDERNNRKSIIQKPIKINDTIYAGFRDASRALHIPYSTIRYRVTNNWDNYCFIL